MDTRRLSSAELAARAALDAQLEAVLGKLRPLHARHLSAFMAEGREAVPEVNALVSALDAKIAALDNGQLVEKLTSKELELGLMFLTLTMETTGGA